VGFYLYKSSRQDFIAANCRFCIFSFLILA
jgi:hypothetical protein